MICLICNKNFKKLQLHLKSHDINPMDYYYEYILKTDKKVRCPICDSIITTFVGKSIVKGLSKYCSLKCKYEGQKESISNKHKSGCYPNNYLTLINYNKSDSHKEKAKLLSKQRRLDKSSKGLGSEYGDRIRNFYNIIHRYNHDDIRYLYILIYNNKLKLGSTSSLKRRLSELSGFVEKILYKDTVYNIANLEKNIFIEFNNYTLLHESKEYYTEFLELSILDELLIYIKDQGFKKFND